MVSPSAKRRAVKLVIETGIGTTAEACRALGLARSSYYCNSTVSLESRQMHGHIVQLSHLRSDNGPEFIAYAIQDWLKSKNVKTIYITPGSPWENAYIETLRNRAWTFACKTEKQTPDGKPVWLRLVYAGETKIRRHVKIRQNANPFDPQWQDYLKERAFHKKFGITRQQAGIKPS